MIFPYWEELQGTEPRIFPLVPLTVHGPAGPIEMPALVDSGAEQSVLPASLAGELGIPLEGTQPAVIVGVGEHEITSHLALVELQLGRHRWRAPVVFADGKVRPVLGQAGFFAFFTVTFRYEKREMDIRWTGRKAAAI